MMNWNTISAFEQIEKIKEDKSESVHLIYKHSTRCSLSSMVLNRLERKWNEDETVKLKPYFLDLIAFRELSRKVSETFEIRHESPQVILVHSGSAIYHKSHFSISYSDIVDITSSLDS